MFFVIFNVTRAILETLPSHTHLVALLSQRAAVSRHTQQRFVLNVFESLVLFGTNVSRSFEPTFSLAVLLGVSPLRGRVWCPASGRLWFPVSVRDVVGPDPARSIVAQIEKCNQVL